MREVISESGIRDRVLEPLIDERTVLEDTVMITLQKAVGGESWELFVTSGRAQPFGVLKSGRVLIGPMLAPLAGLVWTEERGQKRVHHLWVDPEARGMGIAQTLFDVYREKVSEKIVAVGPFTAEGRRAAVKAGAKIVAS